MFIRGSGSGQEYRRNDQSFYRGIVVRNDDPLRLNRVKVYIPELSNQPNDEWFDKFEQINLKLPGINNNSDNLKDVKLLKEIAQHIPWAEPMYPNFGESSNARYVSAQESITISDSNYADDGDPLDTEAPTITDGIFSPAFLYENNGTSLGDAFAAPLNNMALKCNPYSFQYKPDKNVNKAKGVFSIPEVGAKVWVFHYLGELNSPVYFGVYRDYRELTLINKTDNESKESMIYPGDFENGQV